MSNSDDPVNVGKIWIISRRGILRKALHAFFLRLEMMKELNIGAISAERTDSYPRYPAQW